MRGHDQTCSRSRYRAWLWITLFASVGTAPLEAQEGPEAGRLSQAVDPIDLSADRLQVWDYKGCRWVALMGKAAIFQGLEGLRADSAVVRVTTTAEGSEKTYQMDVYAEGRVRPVGQPGAARNVVRVRYTTTKDVRLKPYAPDGVTRQPNPPRGLPILGRGFPDDFPNAVPPPASARTITPTSITGSAIAPSPRPNTTSTTAIRQNRALVDPAVRRAQADVEPPAEPPPGPAPAAVPVPPIELPPIEGAPVVPNLSDDQPAPPTDLQPLPGPGNEPAPPLRRERNATPPPETPLLPGSQRKVWIRPLTSSPDFHIEQLPTTKEGVSILVIRGGVNVVAETPPQRGQAAPPPGQRGIIDLSADSVVIWRYEDRKKPSTIAADGTLVEDAHAPMEIYLEGNVVVRQDNRQLVGTADQKNFRAKRAYYDFRSDRLISLDAQADVFAPGLIAPLKVTAPRIEQFRPIVPGPNGTSVFGMEQIRADQSMMTASRFPTPGYRITNRSVDLTKIPKRLAEPNSGRIVGDPNDPANVETTWHYDARQNFLFFGPVPVFYLPRMSGDSDDLEPALRNIGFSSNIYMGQQLFTSWNGFRLLNIKKPQWIDIWNVDVDYLSMRTKKFPAFGSELGWFGKDFLNDLSDPYGLNRGKSPSITTDYFGYLDVYGLPDAGVDDLGSGPAIVTNKLFLANGQLAGKANFQRGPNSVPGVPSLGVPSFEPYRGRVNMRHMQYFLPDDEEYKLEDFRAQVELGFTSDRYFLEEFYKRLFDTGMDQETLAYLIRQKENHAWTLWTEANLNNWNTETQWLPRLDYYRFGDSLLADWLTYSTHSGVDYANVHTAVEVNNPNIFAFMPYDPISNTSGSWSSGRAFSTHELDLPLHFQFLRVVPYVQGQVAGWTNQIGGESLGRVWGAAGVRADFMAWKAYPTVQSELFNVHGLNHKINFDVDARDAWSNVNLNQIGVQDDLDDNSYESTRRYLALTNFVGGVLPPQYDPRFLILRRAISPISGPADIQASMNTVQMGIHQRLQTKRGPEGKRRIMDYMTLDLTTTYFPNSARDNFGKPFGQNMYNWWWFVGDRTAFYSYGWFEFWNITGLPEYKTNVSHHLDPFGLNVVTSGVSIARPPRANINIGYTVIDSGPLATSALNASVNYWLSPKWYGTFSNTYDFGDGIWLASNLALTRIGADWLTSIGVAIDPQRGSATGMVMITPRASPGVRLGGNGGANQIDTRYAPTQ